MSSFRAASLLLLCTALLAACSSTPSNSSRIDYAKKAAVTAPLDVPPPLVLPAAGTEGVEAPPGPKQAEVVLPPRENVRLARDGESLWLVVQAAPEALWPRVHEFLKGQNLVVKQEDARIGLIETDWAENRADIPEGAVRNFLSKVMPYLYSASTRDKYRLRLERGTQPGTTDIFLSHYGAEQVTRGDEVVWQTRPSDPELVAEMLSRLMQFLGTPADQAQAQVAAKSELPPRARVDGDALVIDEGFPRAWRLTGLALDRVGLVVEDLDRDKGLYYVRQTEAFAAKPEKGWFSRLFSSDKQEETRFRLVLKGDDATSRLTALDDKGEALPAAVSDAILKRLQEQLR